MAKTVTHIAPPPPRERERGRRRRGASHPRRANAGKIIAPPFLISRPAVPELAASFPKPRHSRFLPHHSDLSPRRHSRPSSPRRSRNYLAVPDLFTPPFLISSPRHSRPSFHPVIPAKAGIQRIADAAEYERPARAPGSGLRAFRNQEPRESDSAERPIQADDRGGRENDVIGASAFRPTGSRATDQVVDRVRTGESGRIRFRCSSFRIRRQTRRLSRRKAPSGRGSRRAPHLPKRVESAGKRRGTRANTHGVAPAAQSARRGDDTGRLDDVAGVPGFPPARRRMNSRDMGTTTRPRLARW